MFAIAAIICFVLSPFLSLGPWPLVTVGLIFLTLHLFWPLALPWRR